MQVVSSASRVDRLAGRCVLGVDAVTAGRIRGSRSALGGIGSLSAVVPLGKEHAIHGISSARHSSLSSLTVLAVVSPAAVATGSASPASQLPTASGSGRVVVHTPDGALGGIRTNDVDSFLGIRYAQPPTGRLR
jgi:hypothetical protein